MTHTQKIQQLIDELGYKSFLEIGYGKGNNFNAINVKDKVAVDPEAISGDPKVYRLSSDEYFDQLPNTKKFDLIFIDGLHHADQVERDIVNAWKHLKKGGCIVVHDVWPTSEEMTRVPRVTKQWTGDVFRVFYGFFEKYHAVASQRMIQEDFGIWIIDYDSSLKIEAPFISDISYDEYKAKYA